MKQAYSAFGKRAFDIISSATVLPLISPLMLLTALAIRLEDGGPALYRQERCGARGQRFELLKFRSMPQNTASLASADAERLPITRVGRIIRRTNIDELPQLVNILRGEMSVVGPRPALPSQKRLLELRQQAGATALKPGLTGLAQVSSYDGMPEDEKVRFDELYVQQLSLLTDLKLIFRTFAYLLKPPPAY